MGKPKRTKPMREPRYDNVYTEGVEWLDSLAGGDVVHIYYDRPMLYTTPLPFDLSALVVFADEEEDVETWLIAPMSPEMRDDLHAGRVDLRDAFERPFGEMVGQATLDAAGRVTALHWVPADTIPSDWLPPAGERLSPAGEGA